jgi:hypothetical protein
MPIANRHWTFTVISGAPDEPSAYAPLEDDEIIYHCAPQGSTIQSALHEI